MPNPVFPNIKAPSAIEPVPEDIGIMTNMDDGMVFSRGKFTRSRLTFSVRWNSISYEDQEKIMDFYMNVAKGTTNVIDWTHSDPKSKYFGQVFHVRMISKPTPKYIPPKSWGLELQLQEA